MNAAAANSTQMKAAWVRPVLNSYSDTGARRCSKPGRWLAVSTGVWQSRAGWGARLRKRQSTVFELARNPLAVHGVHSYDFGGFDRRFIHRKLYLEDVVGESVEVAICIDTSGSIQNKELSAFMGEIQGILDAYPQIRGTLFFADADLYGPR